MPPKANRPILTHNYLINHWLITLLTAPFLETPYQFFFGKPGGLMAGLLEMYPITVLISLIYSAPAFIVYCLTYLFLKRQVKPVVLKCLLIGVAVAGIIITFLLIGVPVFSIIYSVAAVVAGVLLPIQKKQYPEYLYQK